MQANVMITTCIHKYVCRYTSPPSAASSSSSSTTASHRVDAASLSTTTSEITTGSRPSRYGLTTEDPVGGIAETPLVSAASMPMPLPFLSASMDRRKVVSGKRRYLFKSRTTLNRHANYLCFDPSHVIMVVPLSPEDAEADLMAAAVTRGYTGQKSVKLLRSASIASWSPPLKPDDGAKLV